MKARLLSFVNALRDAGLSVTVAETLDALQAVRVVGIGRPAFREGLAATLVKDQADRPLFDATFDRFFAVPARQRGKGERRRAGADSGSGGRGRPGSILPRPAPKTEPRQREPKQRGPAAEWRHQSQRSRWEVGPRQLARNKALQRVPFTDMSGRDVEDCEALVKELAQRFRAHLSRRLHRMRRGRLDMRRTVRQSISTGGVPLVPAFRQRRPGRLDLLVLCDCSHSVATASRFLLSLLAPAYDFFRRVRCFAFVDQPVEVSIERGTLVPHEPLDLYARSDFGKVLVEFWKRHEPLLTRNAVLLILGDARNNRRPPRADILSRVHAAVRYLVWLNPETPGRWDTGDSVMRTYQRHCDALFGTSNLQELQSALRHAFRSR